MRSATPPSRYSSIPIHYIATRYGGIETQRTNNSVRCIFDGCCALSYLITIEEVSGLDMNDSNRACN